MPAFAETSILISEMRLAALWLAVALAAPWNRGGSNATIRVTTRLVPVDVLVKDKRTGARVENLTASQFRVSDDGRPQTIAQFSAGGQARPLAVALVVETVPVTMRKTLPVLQSALMPAFQHLRPEDELMVVRMYPGAAIVQDLTSDRSRAAEALQRIAEQQPESKQPRGAVAATIVDLPDALLLAARHIQTLRPGSRAAVVVISGDYNFTPVPAMDQTAMQLLAAGATVHGLIRVEAKYVGAMKGFLSILPKNTYRDQNVAWYSQQTGGDTVKLRDTDFGTAFERVIGDIAGSYTIAFVPDADRFDDRFHKLTVEVNAPNSEDLRVRARSSYYASLEPPVATDWPASDAPAAQGLPELPPGPGVYCQPGATWTRLSERETPRIIITGNHGLPGKLAALRLALVQVYSGAKAPLRIADSQPVFLVRQQREPGFARLARLEEVKGDRWLRVGLFLDKNRQTPNLTIARIGDDLFRLTPESPLSPGEYLLSLNELAAPVYEFGIGPAQSLHSH